MHVSGYLKGEADDDTSSTLGPLIMAGCPPAIIPSENWEGFHVRRLAADTRNSNSLFNAIEAFGCTVTTGC